jgi:sialate O-acetylesterase
VGSRAEVRIGGTRKNLKTKKGKLIVSFTNADGLKTSDGKQPNFFTIAGDDGKFIDAKAVISGSTVILSSPQVKNPKAVRFAWTEVARPNLVNKENLPAVPFRTDALPWEYKPMLVTLD